MATRCNSYTRSSSLKPSRLRRTEFVKPRGRIREDEDEEEESMATSNGDMGIWREDTAGTTYNSASWADYVLDTEVLAEGDFARSGGTSWVDFVMPAGHVLVIQNQSYKGNASAQKATVESGLELDGTDILYGSASGYFLDSDTAGKDETGMAGAAILDVGTTGDILTMRYKRIDSNTGSVNTVDMANRNGLQCVKLDDNRGYFRATRETAKSTAGIVHGNPSSIADLNASSDWEEVGWDSPDEATHEFSLTGGVGTDEIITPSAKLIVTYGVHMHVPSGTVHRQCTTRLQQRDGSGGSWTTIPNSHASGFCMKNRSCDYDWASWMAIIDVTGLTDPRLRVQFIEEIEDAGYSAIAEYTEAYITIGEIPNAASTDYVRLNTEAAETTFVNAAVETTFEAVPTEMDAAFDYISTEVIDIVEEGKYLFFCQFASERAIVDSHVKVPELYLKVNGVDIYRGHAANWSRGDAADKGIWTTSGAGGCMFETGAIGIAFPVSLMHMDNAENNDGDLQCAAGNISLQAVKVSSLFYTHETDTISNTSTATNPIIAATIAGLLTGACGTADATRGGIVIGPDHCYTRDVVQADNYHPLRIKYPNDIMYGFPTSQQMVTVTPISDNWAMNSAAVGASTMWQCVAQDPYDSNNLSYVYNTSGFPFFVGFVVGLSSVPNDMNNIVQITCRFRIKVNNSNGGTTVWFTLNHPDTGVWTSEAFNYPKGSDVDTVETYTLDGFTLDSQTFNDRTSFIGIYSLVDLNDDIRIYAFDMLVYDITSEKQIGVETWTEKSAAASSFSGEKTIQVETYTEKGAAASSFSSEKTIQVETWTEKGNP